MQDGIKRFFKSFKGRKSLEKNGMFVLSSGSDAGLAFSINIYWYYNGGNKSEQLFFLDKEDVDYFITKYTPLIQKELKENIQELEREYGSLIPAKDE